MFQEKSLKSFQEMALLVKKKSQDRETLASHINDTAFIVQSGLANVIMAASVSARVYGEHGANVTHLSLNTTVKKVILLIQGNENWLEKSGLDLPCLTELMEITLVRVIGILDNS